MSNHQDLDALLSELESMEKTQVKIPNMPVSAYLQKAENLFEWAKDDRSALLEKGLEPIFIDSLLLRAGACRQAESVWAKDKDLMKKATGEWKQVSPEVQEFKNELLNDFRYAFRNREDLKKNIDAIYEGETNADMIQDLNDLAVLGKANIPLLEKIGVGEEKLDKAAQLSDEMAGLLARVNGDRHEPNSSKVIRDKAYTFLKEAVDEIVSCGKYAFWKNEERLKGYKSPYSRN